MLVLHALLLFLLSISAMATPKASQVSGRRGRRARTQSAPARPRIADLNAPYLPEQIFNLDYEPRRDLSGEKGAFGQYGGLWETLWITVNIPLSVSPHMNLTYHLAG